MKILSQQQRVSGVAITFLALLSACTAVHTPQPYLPDKSGIQAGESITVKSNENIYTVAHEYNVSMRELIVLNNLKPPFEIRPGQTLVLPAGGASFSGNMPAPEAAPLLPVEKNPLSPIEPAGVTAQPLEPIATQPSSAVPSTSNLTPAQVGPVQMGGAPAQAPLAAPAQSAPTQLAPAQAAPAPLLGHPQTTPSPSGTMTSPATSAAPAAGANVVTGARSINMVWPVQGPILSSFGSKGPGLNNDGVNIGAPKGAPVVAAAPGTVVYAGDEMKGFGNLVLIRHEGDWVTAYAHLDRVLVKKDTVVGQGDMIGTVGKTGNVTSPQLHFETRENGKPVDPAGLIKTNT